MDKTNISDLLQEINWIVTFFGGETLIVSGTTAMIGCANALNQFRDKYKTGGEIYSVVAYPFYL